MTSVKTVEIEHPNGVSMRFSECLTQFLMNRQNKHERFYLGHWLRSLDVDALDQMIALAEIALNGLAGQEEKKKAELQTDDLMMVCIVAEAAETQQRAVTVSPDALFERLAALLFEATIETFFRRGWLEIESVLSICDVSNSRVRITDEGMLAGEKMKMFLH